MSLFQSKVRLLLTICLERLDQRPEIYESNALGRILSELRKRQHLDVMKLTNLY